MARSDTPGIARKPDFCINSCPLAARGNGFVADHVGRSPKLAFLQATPTKADALARKPLTSYGGLFYYTVLGPLGLTLDDIIFSHVLRCDNWVYPTERNRKISEVACRQFDTVARSASGAPTVATGLRQWDPNLFVLTFNLNDAMNLEAYRALLEADIAKAARFARQGYRPLVVMGKEPMELLAPWAAKAGGGVKRHRGDWWEGELPYLIDSAPTVRYNKDLVAVETIVAPKKRRKPSPKQMSLFE